jgi:hypothetical protein
MKKIIKFSSYLCGVGLAIIALFSACKTKQQVKQQSEPREKIEMPSNAGKMLLKYGMPPNFVKKDTMNLEKDTLR